jgi:putative membrane protein
VFTYRSVIRSLAAAVILLVLTTAPAAHAATTELNAQDKAYLQAVHQANLAEVEAGKLAQSKGSSQQVKDLGAMMVTDHTKLDAALRQLATAAKVSLPAAPTADQQAMQAKLASAPAGEFDAMYLSGQIVGHAQVMRLGAMEAAAGADAAVKKAAAAAAPIVAEHYREFVAAANRMGLPGKVKAGRTTDLASSGSSGNEWTVPLLAAGLILIGAGSVLVRRRVVA